MASYKSGDVVILLAGIGYGAVLRRARELGEGYYELVLPSGKKLIARAEVDFTLHPCMTEVKQD